MHIPKFFRKPSGATSFADLALTDGRILRVTDNAPTVGEPALLVDAATGEAATALPAGTYATTSGYAVGVQDGIIVSVTLGTPATGTAPATEMGALRQQVESLNATLQEQQRQFAELATQPAAQPITVRPVAERTAFAGAPAVVTARRAARAWAAEDVAEGIRMIRMAKQGHPEYRFNTANARKYATGTGVDFNDLLARCPDVAKDLFHLMVIEEGLAQHFNVLNVNANGDSALTVELPTLDDTSTEAYLQPGIGCTYIPTGETVLDKRTMDVRPWHYYREYCPKQWGNSFRGLAYVNDEELPYESVILEYLFSKIRGAWERLIMVGDVGGGDAFSGLLTQAVADANIPGAQQVNITPTASTAVAQFEALLAAVPPHLYANVLDEPLLWFVPNQHLEWYVQNYRATFQSLPYNNRFEKFGPDSALKRATFVPTAHLTDTHIVTAPGNLFLGVGKDMQIDVQFHDAGKEQYLFVRVEGHTGVGYPLSGQMLLGTP